MPPSGPSLWLSNNSVQQLSTTASHQNIKNGGGTTMMNNNEHDVIGSLGKALSSVNMAGGDIDNSGRGGGGGQGQQGYGAPGTAVGSHNGSWTGLSGGSAVVPAPAGLSYNYYGNNNNGHAQPPAAVKPATNHGNTEHDSLQNILYDSGIYEKEEVAHRRASTGTGTTLHRGSSGSSGGSAHGGGARPSTPVSNDRERKPSIDIFLSQSPSKTLGEDAFRVMHRTISNPSLNIYHGQHDNSSNNNHAVPNGGGGGLKPLASTAPSSRSESPQTVRSNGLASSNGSSPYNPNNGGNRGMYNPSQFATAANNFSPQGGNHAQLQQQPSLSSQFSSSSNNDLGLKNGQQQGAIHQQQVQQQVPQVQQQQVAQSQYMTMPVSQQQQQPQVFYMAVPAPDGKGQVLQPVQMVQMPGQPGTLMMPMAAANNNNGANGNNQPGGVDGQGQGMGQGMMLMQSAQVNGMNMNNNGVYDAQGGNNNQYPQYGNMQQQQGGYDNGMNRYQSKNLNNNINDLNLGGNQYPDQGNHLDPNQGGAPGNPGSLSMLYSSPQRPPLRALLGNVRRLSRDQVGCRLLQQALDEDGPSAATAILNEGLTFWAEAMVDPFGNYLFQKILERITPEERVTLVSSVSTRLVNASLNLHGTRSVQKIVEVCAVDEENEEEDGSQGSKSEDESRKGEEDDASKHSTKKKSKKKKETAAKILTDALKPSAARLCIDSHGNHAIQRILLKLPYQYTQFIFDAVAASVEDVARHRHGCCVIQRCLDSRHSAARTHLVSRIVEKSLELMQDAYGNYVVQYVLDVCGDDEVHAICESVIGKVCLLAIQKFSSNVMEKCLERCTDRVREAYLDELNEADRIRELMMDPFGNYVVQRALSVSTHAQAIRLVETMKPHLSSQNGGGIRNTAGGRRILGKICRRFPNFVLEGETFEDYDLNQVLARGSPHHHNPHHSGGGRRQNNFNGMPPHPGPSPNHRRNGRGGRNHHQQHQQNQGHNTIPQYQQQQAQPQQPIGQQVGHHVNVQPSDTNATPNYGANPYLFPQSM
mmetsp:Transcript_17198/g.32264  ORF Transcript_17198/g.32264 Transcript_17198/m.32264 type:complete len:1036 (+) Transcript_17198:336-3443(+)|eukprot:CAMPEP_0201658212 /NCGR_PEP_ID=MMETSP0494-20130426/1184_1 /ASSEMBLY_ACC=CAM_ASM_000839 /TAXON_ID=420259 /ORGANISM="Thalassiosira gravida, Strain GMp14c1" /LENGTH=1035 /DNA_ID=CAMNT_0048135177 /DNA_START=332 /DNA_END=3439 /DNA_ORIENTATION=+